MSNTENEIVDAITDPEIHFTLTNRLFELEKRLAVCYDAFGK
jgi:hypothetical protein